MMKRTLLACLVAVMVTGLSYADDVVEKKKGKGKRGANPATQLLKQMEKASVELTEEQTEKINVMGLKQKDKMAAIMKEHELNQKLMASFNKARKETREAGKKRKEMDQAGYEGAGFNETQITGVKEFLKARNAFTKEVVGLLTNEQKEKLPKGMTGGKRDGKKKKKDDE